MAVTNLTEHRIGLAGDWHADLPAATAALEAFSQAGISMILHVGDFSQSAHPDHVSFLHQSANLLESLGTTLWVTEGNHENYPLLHQLNPKGQRTHPVEISPHLLYVPRGFRWSWFGHEFVSLGGAGTIDFESKTLSGAAADLWDAEQIRPSDFAAAVAGGPAHFMISHDAPLGVTALEGVGLSDPHRWNERQRTYATGGRGLLTEAVWQIRPHLLVHGHHHLSYQEDLVLPEAGPQGQSVTTVLGLAKEHSPGNLSILTLGEQPGTYRLEDLPTPTG